jgi:hypothetical protein
MSYLIYVNGLGPNYKGDNMYEFIFSDDKEVWGEEWDSKPANGYPKPPDLQYIKKVGVLKDSGVEFTLIQNSDFFSLTDALDGVICLAWETDNDERPLTQKRMVFRFGDTEKDVKDKLYERDIVLEFEKKVIYETE